jgi:hypothetical protein
MNFFELTLCLLILLWLEAFTDATDYLYKKTTKQIFGTLTHSLQLITFASFAAFGMLMGYECRFGTGHFNWIVLLYTIIGYILFRIAIFNLIYNKLIGQPALYIGTSNLYDRVLNWIISKLGIKNIQVFEMIYGLVIMLALFFGCSFIIDTINRL